MLEPSLLRRWATAVHDGDVDAARELLAARPELLDARADHAVSRFGQVHTDT